MWSEHTNLLIAAIHAKSQDTTQGRAANDVTTSTTNSRALWVYIDFPSGDCECQRHEESGVEISIAYNTRGYPRAFPVGIQKPVLKYFCMGARGG